jgi:hypothetical protein
MDIIGIAGHLKHGKTSLAEALIQTDEHSFYIESGLVIAEVADAFHEQMPRPPEKNNVIWMNTWLKTLPGILQDVVHVDCKIDQLQFTESEAKDNLPDFEKFFKHSVNLVQNPTLAEQKITVENKNTYRPILQWLGGYCVSRVSPSIWYDEIFRRVDSEAEQGATLTVVGGLRYPKDAGIVREHGGKVATVVRPDMPKVDSTDPTERSIEAIVADTIVYNNGDLIQLSTLAPTIRADLAKKSLKPRYVANN